MTTNANQHTRTEKLLLEAARILNSTLDYEQLVEQVLRLVTTAVSAEGALLFRVDHHRTDIKIRMLRPDADRINIFHRDFGTGVVGWVAKHREPELINDASSDPRTDPELERHYGQPINSIMVVPLIGRGQMIGVIEAINKEATGKKAINETDGTFTEADLDILIGLAHQIAVAIDNAHLYRVARRAALQKQILLDITRKLASTLSLREVMAEVLRSLRRTINFNAGGVFVVDPERDEIGEIYTEGYNDPGSADRVKLKIGQGLIGHAATTSEPAIVSDVSTDKRYVSARASSKSEIVVPMTLNSRVIGIINLESDKLNAYTPDDLELLQAFAAQAAVSLERARLHEELLAGKRLEEQLNIAREIQQTFLPDDDPVIKGYDISGRNVPSGQVGGDYYDFINIVEYQTGVAIFDVSGKGIPASLIMASLRASLIAEIRNNYGIRTIASKVNNLVYESVKSGSFVTGVYGVLDSRNHILTFTNCGHNLPFILRADNSVEYLRDGGQVLGVLFNVQYDERPVTIGPADIIVLYTDGVTEVFDKNDTEFGLDRLIELVREYRDRPMREMVDDIYDHVSAWAGPDHVRDDFTMVAIKRIP